MTDVIFRAYRNQIHDLRVHGDQVHAEVFGRKLLGRSNLSIEQFRRHRTTGNYPKPACVADCGNQIALRDPRHRPAHNRDVAAQKIGAALHEVFEFSHMFVPFFVHAEAQRSQRSRALNRFSRHNC